jgi:hypothetical protein
MTNITASELIFTFKMLRVRGMFHDFGCCETLKWKEMKKKQSQVDQSQDFPVLCMCGKPPHICQDIRHSFVNWYINIPSKASFKRGPTDTKHTPI